MKIKLFAAAAAALFAASAQAQSSVTLYGVADVGIEYLSKANGATKPNNSNSRVAMQSGNMSGSRWGLRGVEDLGGGLKALFQLESGFSVDTGAGSPDGLFNRIATVGLQGQFGTLTLGRQSTPMYDFGLRYDPMSISPRYSISAIDAGFISRANNAVKYVGNFNGLTASAMYSFAYDGQEIAGQGSKGREYGASLAYASGPFDIGAMYEQRNTRELNARSASIAGGYSFGPAKAFLGYRYARGGDWTVRNSQDQVTTTMAKVSSNLLWAGMAYNMSPALKLTGAAYYQDARRVSADPWLFVLSSDYSLSKRTDVYLNLAYARNRGDSELGLNGNNKGRLTGIALTNTTSDGNPGNKSQFGAVAGIRHVF
ncbi:porin [Cupriavidus sp. CV2]|uniref:porin n=1 Tax=Cupriavidus ulmosensis TaxID=3065913 RepID=UPI00296AA8EF|nr:porin [Cupriavidus sp. CV2]MDW3686030.1 porin [Cupriavidus sp. CV2]